jgi:hypothetical protein
LWVTIPANPIFVVLRKQKLWLAMQLTATVLRFATFGLSYLVGADAEWALGAFVMATVAGNTIIVLTALVVVKRHEPARLSESA